MNPLPQRKPLVALALAWALAGLHCSPSRVELEPGPHDIVLVTFDALRADRLGCYGYEKDTSPRLDAFAREAHVFTDAMSQSGTTVSSLPSLFTSKFPYTDGILEPYGRTFRLKGTEETLAERLAAKGWNAAAVVGHEYAKKEYGCAQGFAAFDDRMGEAEKADRTVDRALAALDDLESPFFLWIHLRPPHTPYEVEPESFARFHEGSDGAPTLQTSSRDVLIEHFRESEPVFNVTYGASRVAMTPSVLEQYSASYDANIFEGDRAFGRLLDELEARGHGEAVVIVGADHGEALGEHRRIDHNRLYRMIVHVPLLVRLPDRSAGVHDHPVMNVDITPTVLDLVGIETVLPMRGRSLFDPDRDDYYQLAEYEDRRVVKKGRYVLRQPDAAEEIWLHDVFADPDEDVDLLLELPDVAVELLRISESLAPLSESSELMERLRAVGYLE